MARGKRISILELYRDNVRIMECEISLLWRVSATLCSRRKYTVPFFTSSCLKELTRPNTTAAGLTPRLILTDGCRIKTGEMCEFAPALYKRRLCLRCLFMKPFFRLDNHGVSLSFKKRSMANSGKHRKRRWWEGYGRRRIVHKQPTIHSDKVAVSVKSGR